MKVPLYAVTGGVLAVGLWAVGQRPLSAQCRARPRSVRSRLSMSSNLCGVALKRTWSGRHAHLPTLVSGR